MTKTKIDWAYSTAQYVAQKAKVDVSTKLEQTSRTKATMQDSYESIAGALQDVALIGVVPENDRQEKDTMTALSQLRAYNPQLAMWGTVKDLVSNILHAYLVVYTNNDVDKFCTFLLGIYLNPDYQRVPKPYTGSRYVLFENGVFDAKSKKMINIEPKIMKVAPSDGLREINILIPQSTELEIANEQVSLPFVGFTDKHLHNFKLDLDARNPEFNGIHGNWDVETWLQLTAGNDKAQADYLAQIMGVMLIPNHSFNAFIEINGKSSGGKSTIINIVSDIYNNTRTTLMGFTLEDMSDNFPFRGTVTPRTGIVGITEINGAGLSNKVISLLNGFANSEMQMKQMGAESIKLTPPPLIVMDGVGWAMFDSTKTGVSRRLLPVDISNAQTRNYINDRHGKRVFTQKKVLAYFAKRAMLAYADLTNGSDEYMFNIDDLETLPAFVQTWHEDAINAGDENIQKFVERMHATLTDGYMNLSLLYEIYLASIRSDNPDETDVFKRRPKQFKESVGLLLRNICEFKTVGKPIAIEDENKLAINREMLSELLPEPDNLTNYKMSTYAKFKKFDWVEVTVKKENKHE